MFNFNTFNIASNNDFIKMTTVENTQTHSEEKMTNIYVQFNGVVELVYVHSISVKSHDQ